MSWLEMMATSNMPGAIAMIALILLVAAYLIFVLPMMKENEKLKQENSKLLETNLSIEHNTQEILEQLVVIREYEARHRDDIQEIKGVLDKDSTELLSKIEKLQVEVEKALNNLMGKEGIEALIANIKSQTRELHMEDLNKLNQISDLLVNLKTLSEDIKDKQSALNGALLLAGNTNRGLK